MSILSVHEHHGCVRISCVPDVEHQTFIHWNFLIPSVIPDYTIFPVMGIPGTLKYIYSSIVYSMYLSEDFNIQKTLDSPVCFFSTKNLLFVGNCVIAGGFNNCICTVEGRFYG